MLACVSSKRQSAFFEERDVVAVHTLASAAQNVLHDIAGHRKLPRFIDRIVADKQQWYRRWHRESYNFFKHGDQDPEGSLEFSVEQPHWKLFEAVYLSIRLGVPANPTRALYFMWFISRHPNTIRWDECPPEMLPLHDISKGDDPIDPSDLKWFRQFLQDRPKLPNK